MKFTIQKKNIARKTIYLRQLYEADVTTKPLYYVDVLSYHSIRHTTAEAIIKPSGKVGGYSTSDHEVFKKYQQLVMTTVSENPQSFAPMQ